MGAVWRHASFAYTELSLFQVDEQKNTSLMGSTFSSLLAWIRVEQKTDTCHQSVPLLPSALNPVWSSAAALRSIARDETHCLLSASVLPWQLKHKLMSCTRLRHCSIWQNCFPQQLRAPEWSWLVTRHRIGKTKGLPSIAAVVARELRLKLLSASVKLALSPCVLALPNAGMQLLLIYIKCIKPEEKAGLLWTILGYL